MDIRYLKNNEIDRVKWDKCIAASVNGILYAQSAYLNIVCRKWDALVLGNYEAVMPLPWKRIYRFKVLYQPLFTQQLGIFSPHRMSPALVDRFISEATRYFPYININLNTFNICTLSYPDITQRVTYEIDLIESYQVLRKRFSVNTIRNIKAAMKEGVTIKNEVTPRELIKLKHRNQIVKIKYQGYQKLKKIMSYALNTKSGKIYGAFSAKGKLVASALFIGSHHKVIYLVSSSNPEGKKLRAMFLLIDQFIRDFSGNHLTLDFEGSMIASIARFFQNFGAKPCYYQNILINNLPWYIKILR